MGIAAEPSARRAAASFMVLSNAAIALGAARAFTRGWHPHGVVYALSTLASVAHHVVREGSAPIAAADQVLATGVFLANAHATLCGGSAYALVGVALALLGVAAYAACAYRRDLYETLHPWWHVVAGAGTWLLYEGMRDGRGFAAGCDCGELLGFR